MATRNEPARPAPHRVLRPKLLLSAAIAALVLSIPAIDQAFAGTAGPPTLLPKGRAVIGTPMGAGKLGNVGATGAGKVIGNVGASGLGKVTGHLVDPNVPGRGDPGRGHVVTNNTTDRPPGNTPRPPRSPIPRPHFVPPIPLVPTHPTVVTSPSFPVIGNPNPVIGNP